MKYTVSAREYKEHQPVTTEGTVFEAIKAFQCARGLDGINLEWTVVADGGATTTITALQWCSMVDQEAKKNPPVANTPEPFVFPEEHVKPTSAVPAHADKGHEVHAEKPHHSKK